MNKRFPALFLCAVFAAFSAAAQEPDPPVDEDAIERLPAQIEDSVRDLVDRIQESVRGAVAQAPEPLNTTLALTFTVEDLSGPIRILCADGTYSLDVQNTRTQRNEVGQPIRVQEYALDVSGLIVSQPTSHTYRISYAGSFKVNDDAPTAPGESREGHMDLNGSVIVEIGKTVTLAENEEWALTLTVDEVKPD